MQKRLRSFFALPALLLIASPPWGLPAPPQEAAARNVEELAEAVLAALEEADAVVDEVPPRAPDVIRTDAKSVKRKDRRRRPVEGTLPVDWVQDLPWRSIGPANMGGRVVDLAVHPTDPTTYWVATASGGLLKTTNRGVTYRHQFDGEPTVSIGAIAVSQSDPNIVWVGTGEANPRNSVSWGDGLYRSKDGGETWEHRGLPDSCQVGGIVIHPSNPDTVYVGALGRLWGPNEERGLFKTTDGGDTWAKILYVDEDTGVIDVLMHPTDPETLLVATYVRRRDGFDSNDPWRKWGPGAALYKSTDGGQSFRRLTEGLPRVELGRIGLDYCTSDPDIVYAVIETERIGQEPEDAAFAGLSTETAEVGARITRLVEEGPAERAGLKVDDIVVTVDGHLVVGSRELSKRIRQYVAGETVRLVISRDKEAVEIDLTFDRRPEQEEDKPDPKERTNGVIEAPKPDFPRPGPFSGGLGGQRANVQDDQGDEGRDYGGVYRSMDGGETWTRVNSVNPRPMYYSQIRVDPSDANHVYVLGTSLYRSKDGGVTFTSDGAGRGVHVDHHALWIDPTDGRHMILGNDGGIYVTWDRMESWDHHNHVAIGQFYDVTADNTLDYKVYGGLQDNGSWGGPNRTGTWQGPDNTDWISIGGGDGFVCRVDANDPDLVYYESQNGGTARIHLGTGEGGYMRPRGTRGLRYRFSWKTPFLLSHFNSRIYYSAGNFVFRSLDRGQGLRRISPEISRTDRGAATALAESPREHDELYVGTDDGSLWMTADGGREWRDLFALNASMIEEEVVDADVAVEATLAPTAEAGGAVNEVDDALTGDWTGTVTAATPEARRLGLTLRLGTEGSVTGIVQWAGTDSAVVGGRFDSDTGDLRFTTDSDGLVVRFVGTVVRNVCKGTMIGPGGSFHLAFEVRRGGAEPTPEPAVEPAPPTEPPVDEPAAEEPSTAESEEAAEEVEFIEDTIDQLLPGRYRVSCLVASRHADGRVYVTFDGHYFDDYLPYAFVSEDRGTSWKSLRGNLPDHVGSVRCITEDVENENLLFLGTEFGAYVSIDRGLSWTQMGGDLPTVAVHAFHVQEPTGDLIAGTHGRSVWIANITHLRQMTAETVEGDAVLYAPQDMVVWRRERSRGSAGTRSFHGENPPASVPIYYSLGRKARDLSLSITQPNGDVVYELDASGDKGLHRVTWDRRTTRTTSQGRRRGGRRAEPGTYVAVLRVGDQVQRQEFEVHADPRSSDGKYLEYEEERDEQALQRHLDDLHFGDER